MIATTRVYRSDILYSQKISSGPEPHHSYILFYITTTAKISQHDNQQNIVLTICVVSLQPPLVAGRKYSIIVPCHPSRTSYVH